ncbi:hypothetical protein AYI68_g1900 [Smittium mucronatum]|uniref:Uncharacterized protein n=1 Tax=Smittium mucronatum TaxID=133383 RepID=A0A1R0H4F7_9FUNG|nr:hypothetical protein AYI68_g1900 [Smittium mucronatum]
MYNSLTPPICTSPVAPCENLTGWLGSALNERPIKEDIRSSITASPAKLTDVSKSSLNAKASEEDYTEVSLSLSLDTSRQASTSGANP